MKRARSKPSIAYSGQRSPAAPTELVGSEPGSEEKERFGFMLWACIALSCWSVGCRRLNAGFTNQDAALIGLAVSVLTAGGALPG
jgi:hypothetical protein